MAEAIYKVGDILEIESQYGMFSSDKKSRCLVLKCIKPGYEFIIYTLLVLKSDDSFAVIGVNQKDIILTAKRVGHIDISALRYEKPEEGSGNIDLLMLFTAGTITQVADLRNELAGTCKENKMLKNENEVLKRENEELRSYNKELEQALSKSEEKAHSRLDEITFLTRKVDELENTNKKLKAECDEASHEISRLRTVIGGLNDVIDDLNTSKSEISDLFYSLSNVLQTSDILEGVNKLTKENERLSNENENLKAMNDELSPEYSACTEKIKKLEAENARYLQSMTCARKQMTEAAKRICEAEEHIDVAIYSK